MQFMYMHFFFLNSLTHLELASLCIYLNVWRLFQYVCNQNCSLCTRMFSS